MKTTNLLSTGLALIVVGFAPFAYSDKTRDYTRGLALETLQSPQLDGGNSRNFKPKDWLEIEVTAKLDHVKPEIKNEPFHNKVSVNWNLVFTRDDKKTYWIKKSVDYVNVPADEETTFSIYLSPNTLKRITGKAGGGKIDFKAIGGEIRIKGKPAGFFNQSERKGGWWGDKVPKSVTVTERFPILNKDETPFRSLWHDRHPRIKPTGQ